MNNQPKLLSDDELHHVIVTAFNTYHMSALNYGLNEGATAIDDLMDLIKQQQQAAYKQGYIDGGIASLKRGDSE